jgi:hypothetical protein
MQEVFSHNSLTASATTVPRPENGVTVFLQGLEKRGPDNRRKRIYMSVLTPDLYRPR